MSTTRLSVAARTDAGRVRDNNEDSFTVADLNTGERIDDPSAMDGILVKDRGVLLVVSDGMGGHAAGEVASALVVDSLRGTLGEMDDHSESAHQRLEEAVKRVNANVYEAARSSAREGMGATLTAVVVHQREAYIAEVGDSRAYVLRRGRLRQMTKDQSFVQMLIDSGAITTDQAKNFFQKNWIVQAMGLEANVHVALGRLQLRTGDRLLICSDGLYSLVEEHELAELLAGDDLTQACHQMIDLANERGGTDNVTAIVALIESQDLPFAGHDESVTQTFEVLKEYAGEKIVDPSRSDSRAASTLPPSDSQDSKPQSQIQTVRPPAPDNGKSSFFIIILGILALIVVALLGYWFFSS
ncbi:MAG TPA: Stp1/IreP family PP2C-type Ser/Thr phosphatase [Polyangiaceae bacterium]|jgi:serine/threonine protein phosphatase PrpC|nr:MAG: Serine/threonine phosphatase stp [Deltaproteobacteria bacterium ADurb.Bin207]HNZ25154.1 Stp1/IreP family PP2C-type Ser/Thr phosphatase [Polyangiaceae bacterium]HOD24127.1 Stp1/IreP family PP2C-type Ser/Thr phosphatase [Polyangiaceae bacterium]HOE51249.1 Stp1/IreP family PP2C-type Ser/Thr phosphatase [Polyangiaceae bacterium]HOH03252.1 Stp1/IreP family PP2C-type Ser/Thr phosphatase [Polyangiaceae bacterium]